MTEMNENCVIKIENLSKEYRLGAIGSGTLRHDLQSWYAKKRGVSLISETLYRSFTLFAWF